jgi:peptide/nickel transport system permease protein
MITGAAPPVRLSGARRLLRSDRLALVCAAAIALAAFLALAAPLLAPYDPTLVNLSAIYQGPSSQHLLGTDSLGRDLLSRLIWGARSSLVGPAIVIVISATAATAIALAAAWLGGKFDAFAAAILDVTFAFPALLLAIVAVAVFGTGLTAPVIALAIAYTPYIARVVRGAALRERRLPYVEALSVQGFSGPRIALRHILPNISPIVAAQATLAFAYATVDLAALSFLGLGVQPPTADWGLMVAQGQPAVLAHRPAEAIYPGIALILVIVSVTLLGQRLARRADARP